MADPLIMQLLQKVDKLLGIAIEIREATVKKPLSGGSSAYDSISFQVPPSPEPPATDQVLKPPPSVPAPSPSPDSPVQSSPEKKTVPDLPKEYASFPYVR